MPLVQAQSLQRLGLLRPQADIAAAPVQNAVLDQEQHGVVAGGPHGLCQPCDHKIKTTIAPSARAANAIMDQRPNAANCSSSHRSEEHTSELQSLMRISYAVFCLKKKKKHTTDHMNPYTTSKHMTYCIYTNKT